jgi:large subunit ribosomal protein L18
VIRIKRTNKTAYKTTKRLKNRARIRKKVDGDTQRPRLAVYRSGRHIYAQIIDDSNGKTLVAFSTLEGKLDKKNLNMAKQVGQELAKRAQAKNIKSVVFDRSIKAVADGAREAGLSF